MTLQQKIKKVESRMMKSKIAIQLGLTYYKYEQYRKGELKQLLSESKNTEKLLDKLLENV